VNMRLLQEVLELNQSFERVIEGLKRMEKVPFLQAEMVREDRAEVVLAQSDFNRLFFEDFYKEYEKDEKWAADFQRACESKRCRRLHWSLATRGGAQKEGAPTAGGFFTGLEYAG